MTQTRDNRTHNWRWKMISNFKMVRNKNKDKKINKKDNKNNSSVTLNNKEKVFYNGQMRKKLMEMIKKIKNKIILILNQRQKKLKRIQSHQNKNQSSL